MFSSRRLLSCCYHILALIPATTWAMTCPDIDGELGPQLSVGASIVHQSSNVQRWSDFGAPQPGSTVNVASENDVQVTIKYCNSHDLQFLTSAGANGWANTFTIDECDVIINLRSLKTVSISADKTQLTHGGGAITSEVINAALAAGVQVVTPNCNCVSNLGAYLGGGFSRLSGKYGLGVDNLISMNMVTAAGDLITVTEASQPALWWALRGAGANFGIVTSATIKAYAVPAQQNNVWLGALLYTPDKIEALVSAIQNLHLDAPMAVFMYYAVLGQPTVVALPYYANGTAEQGRAAFASLYAVGPFADTTAITPYDQVNAGGDSFCIKGGRKPSFGVGLARLDPPTWRTLWNDYIGWLNNPGTSQSAILMEAYSMDKARSLSDDSSSYAFRSTINFQAVVIPWYTDASLDPVATAFGKKARNRLRATDGLEQDSTYINFANGDEPLSTIYGKKNTRKLLALKAQWDPENVFDQWFPLSSGKDH